MICLRIFGLPYLSSETVILQQLNKIFVLISSCRAPHPWEDSGSSVATIAENAPPKVENVSMPIQSPRKTAEEDESEDDKSRRKKRRREERKQERQERHEKRHSRDVDDKKKHRKDREKRRHDSD